MINLIVGKPGTGKTYFMSRIGLEEINDGRDIYVSEVFPLRYPPEMLKKGAGKIYTFKTLTDIVSLKNGVVLLDEMQVYFNSRDYYNLPLAVQYKLQQHRHDGLDIWGTAQRMGRIDVVLRELVNSVYEVKRFPPLTRRNRFKPPWFFMAAEYDTSDIDKVKRQSLSRKWFWFRKNFARCYDTHLDGNLIRNSIKS